MKSKIFASISILALISVIFVSGCLQPIVTTPETHDVNELLFVSIYDRLTVVYGIVSDLGELFCPCFTLTSGGKSITVWYDLMVEDDGTVRPAVDVSAIKNGDEVMITGELKNTGTHTTLNDFWMLAIVEIKQPIGGETDEHGCMLMAGYRWCESKQKCLRTWEEYCAEYKDQFSIDSFDDCIAAGFPAMESYPRQCRTSDDETFTEDLCDDMSSEEAKQIALASVCVENGTLSENSSCNEATDTWWIDLDIEKAGCSPACVVNIVTHEAEINWRCTGLI